MKVTTKCKINPLSDLSGNMWKPQKCDGQMDGRADGWVGLFLFGGVLINIVVTDIGLSMMFDIR